MRKSCLLLCLFITSFSYSQSLRLAVYQYADNPRIKNLQPLGEHIQQQLGINTTVKSYPTVHAFIDAIQKGEVDMAFINTFGYLLLEASNKAYPMQPKVALVVPNPTDNYKTAFVVKATSPINQLRDIKSLAKQTRLGLVAVGSTSGNLIPRLALTKIGIPNAEQQFQSVHYMGTHVNAIQRLFKNEVDLAAMGSNEYTKLDTSTQKQLKLVWLSNEIPLGPVLLHKDLPDSLQQQLTQLLLGVHQQASHVLESIKAAWSEAKQATHFQRINKKYYDPFLSQFGRKQDLQPILKQFAN